ncbi:hypothetical protein PVAND_011558 [Polypedilum vanderplanki]|uniref:Borealin C-terminal domain-containing protein n=1 Tax=Polypedilum vanderplanki TaxID=319348 RepID=A0A9J6CKS4_POLVA|nr:hypothetical protein PVAND_011558 [Polypedilum vanderplanki]
MPRTKLTKGGSNKRARENVAELEDLLRDFDIEFDSNLQTMRRLHQKNLEDADNIIEGFKMELGNRILSLTMGDLKKMNSLNEIGLDKTVNNLNATIKETLKKVDEGYLTEEASNKSRLTSDSESGSTAKVSIIGPLKAHKSRRRSQSANNVPSSSQVVTPGPRAMISHLKMRTPLATLNADAMAGGFPSSHVSRSKFRTPLQKSTQPSKRAASADRVQTIIPKCNPTTPISILRHARVGEVAFSVTGSPIVPTSVVESTANVNIPVANGILSIRPQNLDPSTLNTSLLDKFDNGTIDHLRKLKANLDTLMAKFEEKNNARH